MGERYTICDPYLFTLAQWLEADGVEPKRIPRVIDHRRRVSERAATRRALQQELTHRSTPIGFLADAVATRADGPLQESDEVNPKSHMR